MDYKDVRSDLLKQTVLEMLNDRKLKERITGMKKKMENCPGNQGGVKYILDYYASVCSK